MLATSGQTGATEAIMLAHGFPAALLAGLARHGLVTEAIGTMRAGARVIQVRRLSITAVGRLALATALRRRPLQDMRRKGEITLPQIKRKWPHHVAISADKVRGVRNSEIVWSLAETLSAAPRPYAVRRDEATLWYSALLSWRTRRRSPSGSAGSACRAPATHDGSTPSGQ
jgi:hypothetical protein